MTHSTHEDTRRDGLAALAAAEAYARRDFVSVVACDPATAQEALHQRNFLVMALGDVIEAGGQHFVDAVRAALIDGPEDVTNEQATALADIDDEEVRRLIAATWANEQRIMRGKDTE